jgi:hypothetical protein
MLLLFVYCKFKIGESTLFYLLQIQDWIVRSLHDELNFIISVHVCLKIYTLSAIMRLVIL